MKKLKYTKIKPKVKGWYWYKQTVNGEELKQILEVFFGEKTKIWYAQAEIDKVFKVDECNGLWSDEPIEEAI
jgi:hypothetical protein